MSAYDRYLRHLQQNQHENAADEMAGVIEEAFDFFDQIKKTSWLTKPEQVLYDDLKRVRAMILPPPTEGTS